MAKKTPETPKPIEFTAKSDLSPIWVDTLNIGVREDDIVFIRFLTNLPEGTVEQTQIITSKDHMKKFVGAICSSINYYPSKKEKTVKNKK